MVDAFPNLKFNLPLFLTSAGDGTGRIFVVQQDGLIKVFPNDSTAAHARTFLDLSQKISSHAGEEGLLGLAFAPDFRTSGAFYVDYSAFKQGTHDMQVVVARYAVSRANPDSADPASEERLLAIDKPFQNHNGGMLAFGPDGYLYIGVGDGGDNGDEIDPFNYGQDRTVLLGKILRIAVGSTGAYRIPPDNPFAGNSNGWKQEIWAYGLRNPWRFSFDPANGTLWAGDVGQAAREEIDIIVKGGNYGWKIMEGRICRPGGGSSCDSTGLIMPITDYPHEPGEENAVVGGYVYRGLRHPELAGAYLYGDWGTGKIRLLRGGSGGPVTQDTLLAATGKAIASFGVDEQSELYFTGWADGAIYRFAGGGVRLDTTQHPSAPQVSMLEQNSPNPVSLVTRVEYRVATPGPVKLRVYDVLGREMMTAVDQPMAAGTYAVHIDTTPWASGTYYYRLQTPDGVQIRRMIVVR
ncbi:MAG TPA: PQQ-dependent sugar dehydrogenase [Bacteroidota bacterium]